MCEYVALDKCSLTNEICPFMYFCERKQIWKPSTNMPTNCGVKERAEAPKGYYRVREERKGYLYVDIEGQTYKIKNPFDDSPKYVKAYKTKDGWRLRK